PRCGCETRPASSAPARPARPRRRRPALKRRGFGKCDGAWRPHYNPVMAKPVLILVMLICIAPLAAALSPQSDPLLDRARKLLSEVPIIDGHNDYPWEVRDKGGLDLNAFDITKPQPTLMTDFARLKAGGVGGQFWSVYVPSPDPKVDPAISVTQVMEQIGVVHRMVARWPDRLALALSSADIERIQKQGKIASLIGIE